MSYAIHPPNDELVCFMLIGDEGDTYSDCIFRAFPLTSTAVSEWIKIPRTKVHRRDTQKELALEPKDVKSVWVDPEFLESLRKPKR